MKLLTGLFLFRPNTTRLDAFEVVDKEREIVTKRAFKAIDRNNKLWKNGVTLLIKQATGGSK